MRQIRYIATSFQGDTIAVAEFEKNVQIFNIKKQEVVAEFETVLDYGGKRLAISENGQICICGCWERFGICGYNANNGNLIWQRKDLKKVQTLKILYFKPNVLFARFEKGAGRLLDIETGADIIKLSDVVTVFESKFQSVNIYDRSNKIEIIDRIDETVTAKIKRHSWATLDAVFSPDSILISEVGGSASCYQVYSGELKWRIKAYNNEHYLLTGFNEQLEMFVCLSHNFENNNKMLIYVDYKTGKIQNKIAIGQPTNCAFLQHSQFMITSDRKIINIKNGDITGWISEQNQR